MSRRPWSLIVLAFLHFLAPIGNIIFNAVINNKDILSYLLSSFSLAYFSQNWVIIVAPIVSGIAIYACKKWSFYVYLLSSASLFIFSYQAYVSKASSIGVFPVLLVFFINIVIVVYFLIPAVRNIYFDKRMRWWEIKPRYQSDFKAQWNFEDDTVIHPGVISNISVNGLFLKSEIMPRDQDMIHIKVPFNKEVDIEFFGQVIFHKKASKIGFGVEFAHSKESKEKATEITQFLEEKGMRIRSLDIKPEDSFSFWIRTLLTTGKGLIPVKK
jgi:hypothetical protein